MPRRQKDAIELLEKDHKLMRSLLDQFSKAREDKERRRDLLKRIEHELKVHTRIEEEIFYPAFKEACKSKKDIKIFFEAHEEHHIADVIIAEIKNTAVLSDEFAAKAKVLKDMVEHHAEEEETEMFPRARKLMSDDDLLNLGKKLDQRKKSLAPKIK